MKKIFIAAPFFPPSAMPPAQRVRLLVRHLYEFDWEPVIFTVDQYYREEIADPWMVAISGNKYKQYTTGCFDQRKTRKIGIGDLGLRMFFYLFFAMRKRAKTEQPDLILYPVPSWYIMVMAPFLKWITGVPYAIDYIDPWIFKIKNPNFKARLSQWLARSLEGFVIKRSDVVFAVSQGILNDLIERYPFLKSRPMAAVPYGVEISDFSSINVKKKPSATIQIRYTGAVSEAMHPVMDTLLKAFKKIQEIKPIEVVFTGTNYAGKGLVKPVLHSMIASNGVDSFVKEYPERVTYREALEIGAAADIQLLVGDTTPYYAASKLMGLVAAQIPFFPFVHAGSFPAAFLNSLKYPYIQVFETSTLGTELIVNQLADNLLLLINGLKDFIPIDRNNEVLSQYSAKAMTKLFTDKFEIVTHDNTTPREN